MGDVWTHPTVEPLAWWLVGFAMYAVGRFALAYAIRRITRREGR